MVARAAVLISRAAGFFTALGMGMGGLIFACLSLLGLHSILLAVPSLYLALKVVGGLYLVYLGYKIWRGAGTPLSESHYSAAVGAISPIHSFVSGLSTQLSNPKTAIVYASVFAAFLPERTSITLNVSVAFLVFTIEAGWYSLVAITLSTERTRQAYLRCKAMIDRVAGGISLHWVLSWRCQHGHNYIVRCCLVCITAMKPLWHVLLCQP